APPAPGNPAGATSPPAVPAGPFPAGSAPPTPHAVTARARTSGRASRAPLSRRILIDIVILAFEIISVAYVDSGREARQERGQRRELSGDHENADDQQGDSGDPLQRPDPLPHASGAREEPVQGEGGEVERDAEPERVRPQQRHPLQHRLLEARIQEDRREHRSDARRPARAERGSDRDRPQLPRRPARELNPSLSHEGGDADDSEHVQTEQHDQCAADLLEQRYRAPEQAAQCGRAGAQYQEYERKADDEERGMDRRLASRPRAAGIPQLVERQP